MIIEFFGISGVGKSTICKEIYKNNNVKWPRYKLYETNSWLVRNIKKFVSIVIFSLYNFMWILKINNILKKYETINMKDKINLLFNGCSLKILQKKCENLEEKYIFDEGVFQYIWSVYLRANKDPVKDEIVSLLSLFDMPKKLFVVTADSDIILKRLKLRNRKTKILSSDNIIDRIEQMKKVLNDIILISKEYSKETEIIFLNTNEELKDVKKIRI